MARKRGERQRPTLRKGSSSARKNPTNFILPRPVGRVSDLSPRSQSARNRALNALASMRRHSFSFTRAAHEAGTTTQNLKYYLGWEFRQDRPGSRIRATKSDRQVRGLQIPTLDGIKEI